MKMEEMKVEEMKHETEVVDEDGRDMEENDEKSCGGR